MHLNPHGFQQHGPQQPQQQVEEGTITIHSPSPTGLRHRLRNYITVGASWNSLPEMWDFLAGECGDLTAIVDPVHPPDMPDGKRPPKGSETRLTYSEMRTSIGSMAAALIGLGLEKQDCVSVFSENSYRWLIAEQGIMKAGGCNAVRGATAPVAELRYIYGDSESVGAVVETPKLLKLLVEEGGKGLEGADGAEPRFLMVLFPGGKNGKELQESLNIPESIKVVTFSECLDKGGVLDAAPVVERSMKATLVYTSGTTGKPKGAVLTHANLLHQVSQNSFDRSEGSPMNPWVGDVFVSILPCWHIFERTAEYFTLTRGVTMGYSNVRNFKSDLKKFKPHFLIVVPRLLETIWKGVQTQLEAKSKGAQKAAGALTRVSSLRMKAARRFSGTVIRDSKPKGPEKALSAVLMGVTLPLKLAAEKLVWGKIRDGVGGRVKVVVSGGSSLPSFLEDFFEMAGVRVLVGYGLTETSPVIANRVATENTKGTTGKPVPGSEVKIADQETGQQVAVGQTGKILIRGPQVMSGYQNNPEATAAVIDKDGYFDTGDLGRFNPITGDLIVTGRAKDTIVLSNGENVEPQPLEDAISGACSLIDQVMLFGQDERFLGAIVCLNPLNMGAAGIISQEDASRYSGLLGPTPLTTGPAGTPKELADAEKEILGAPGLERAVMDQLKAVAGEERPWEQVGSVIMKFEPFTTSNGLITQTLKTKRNVVAERFSKEIDALYAAKR
ncbi:long chain acyl-CoA synthetase [Ectocarpus siliculosus]|uniref:Long chain acyl-CoA synthetase n=1 Tax=Ectocarpus siliculosus TaxID=2880 RepID=D7FZ64_ECTSI|nr:long chain acyl-CoA synthetase [Ectocarpus siliculosus]|eukprot:CBJ32681.1 long chain acyl-CoA synthetase [Ectocarpus siliculosus]